jgi:hypothetical protein
MASVGFDVWYEIGTAYVCQLFQQGGWELVNATYEQPPRSTAEILGIACDPVDPIVTATPTDWDVVFDDARGPLWFGSMATTRGADMTGLSSWCADRQRIFETPGGALVMIMDIWVGNETDAELVSQAAEQVFMSTDLETVHLITRTDDWIGIASASEDLPLCELLPAWCG